MASNSYRGTDSAKFRNSHSKKIDQKKIVRKKLGLLNIVEWPAKVLETKAKEVANFDSKLQGFVKDMHTTMDHANGIGLAANQVNSAIRVITIYIPSESSDSDSEQQQDDQAEVKPWHDKRYTFINPKIIKKNGKARYLEGCLSFPEVYDYVDRADTVTVSAFDEFGKPFEIEADGLFSICIQHEIDHIDGIVFINRMSRLKAQMARKKVAKRKLLSSQDRG